MKSRVLTSIVLFFVFVNATAQQKDSSSIIGGAGLSAEYIYANRQGFNVGIGICGYSKGKKWYESSERYNLKGIKGQKAVELYPKPIYIGFNQGVLFQNNSSQTLINNSQLQLFIALQAVSFGTRLTYYTDYKTHSQAALTSELGLGWRHVFVKGQYNYYLFNINPFALPKFTLAAQVIFLLK